MASLTNLGKALQERGNAWSFACTIARGYSRSRNDERSFRPVAKVSRSELPVGNSTANHLNKFSPASMNIEAVAKQMNDGALTPEENLSQSVIGPLFGKRRKRSSETIRHDKLYLRSTDMSKREYAQTWIEFEDKRSIPVTEWGEKRIAE